MVTSKFEYNKGAVWGVWSSGNDIIEAKTVVPEDVLSCSGGLFPQSVHKGITTHGRPWGR